MKRMLCFLLILLSLCLPAAAESHTVLYFYRNYCESCAPEEDFANHFRSLTGISLSDCDFTAWNVVRAEGQQALDQALADLGLDSCSLPMVIVDGIVYQGAGEMNSSLVRNALSWQPTNDSPVLYLYTPACENCAEAENVLSSLPDHVELRRGEIVFNSRVEVRRVDISADPAFAQAVFEAYNVEDGQRVTPAVFFGDHALTGIREIKEKLLQEIQLGWASGGLKTIEAQSEAAQPSLLPSIGAGLIAGLNTCALSMLLLFLSLILPAGRRSPAVAFLAAKFICYLLIGFVFTQLLQRLNPTWLLPFSKWLMTIFGGMLIILNLTDAFHASRGELGAVRNQLPGSLRGRLRRLIKALIEKKRALIPASALLGFLVAGGEFMCAGQLYLMQLISYARYSTGQGLALFIYCLAFLLPSVLITFLVFRSQTHLRASSFFANHLAIVKLLTAGAMLALVMAAWLL